MRISIKVCGVLFLLSLIPIAQVYAAKKMPRVESATSPERSSPRIQARTQSFAVTQATNSEGPNLISNSSLENADGSGNPSGWLHGGYGSNTRSFVYPVAGTGGTNTKAIRINVTNYVNGDAKWFFVDVPITAQSTYQFSDLYISDVPSIITARFKLTNGTYIYTDLATLPATTAFTKASVNFSAPPNASSVTLFHLIKQNGSLTTDEYALHQVTTSTDQSNLIPNGDFEIAAANNLPQNWSKGGYGSNTRTYAYPISGASASGAQISISNWTSGDAKWVFDPVAVQSGSYIYSDMYKASVPSILTAAYRHTDGTYTYQDLKTLSAAASWTLASIDFTVPSGVSQMTIYHLIKQNGSLSIDSAALKKKGTASGVFTTGAVTLRFDDELLSQYENAYPKLSSAGMKATFYVVSRQTADDGFADVMSKAQLQDLYGHGHEIGAHTRTHPDLTTLSASQQQSEIQGSRQDLLSWNVGPVSSFSYPFGAYNATTLQIVKDSGFSSATATNGGYVTQSSDPYQLERQSIRNTTTLNDVKVWVDSASTNHTWLILEFHGIDLSGTAYSMTPAVFNQVIDYIKQKGIPVVTISEGVQSL